MWWWWQPPKWHLEMKARPTFTMYTHTDELIDRNPFTDLRLGRPQMTDRQHCDKK